MIMLMISEQRRRPNRRIGVIITVISLVLIGGGLYIVSLITAPVLMPVLKITKPIDVKTLAKPSVKDDRIIIPKIGVDIAYGKGQYALDHGAEWRRPDSGNPADGGNFVIAAHRFTLAATPADTAIKSPFYHIDKLIKGDKIIIDYGGARYGYEVSEILQVAPDRVDIEDPSSESKLTLYSCTLGGSRDGRIVIIADPLGEVSVTTPGDSSDGRSSKTIN